MLSIPTLQASNVLNQCEGAGEKARGGSQHPCWVIRNHLYLKLQEIWHL